MTNFRSNPNQEQMKIHRVKPGDKNFILADEDTFFKAMKDIKTKSGFFLYCYLMKNADGFNLWMSPSNLYETAGIADSTYRDGKKKLIEKGYLVPCGNNKYDFYERPENRRATTKTVEQPRKPLEESRNPIEKQNIENKKNNREYRDSALLPTVKEPVLINADGYDNNGDFGF